MYLLICLFVVSKCFCSVTLGAHILNGYSEYRHGNAWSSIDKIKSDGFLLKAIFNDLNSNKYAIEYSLSYIRGKNLEDSSVMSVDSTSSSGVRLSRLDILFSSKSIIETSCSSKFMIGLGFIFSSNLFYPATGFMIFDEVFSYMKVDLPNNPRCIKSIEYIGQKAGHVMMSIDFERLLKKDVYLNAGCGCAFGFYETINMKFRFFSSLDQTIAACPFNEELFQKYVNSSWILISYVDISKSLNKNLYLNASIYAKCSTSYLKWDHDILAVNMFGSFINYRMLFFILGVEMRL
ncbi:MAG: hypothetical protein KAH32_04060 [Chlamydiia bacterium]|nr:hypothetical protein [Chlamydiia bacterium]